MPELDCDVVDIAGKVGGSCGIGRHRLEDARIVMARIHIRGMVDRRASRMRKVEYIDTVKAFSYSTGC
jgi:hypothetical protein